MTSDCSSRRSFLKTSLLGSAAALAAARLAPARAQPPARAAAPAADPRTSPAAIPSRVSLTTGDDRVKNTFDSLTPFKREIAAAIGNKRVVLKPNCVMTTTPLCATHADQLEGILEFLKSIGKAGNVVLAESPANGTGMMAFDNYGYTKVAANYGVKLVNLDDEVFDVVQVLNQHDMQPHDVRMAKMMMDPANNYVISAAKFKTHNLVGVTLSLKNVIVGAGIKDTVAGRGGPGGGMRGGRSDKPTIHGGGPYGINYNLFTLSAKLHPDLAVIDGYEGMEGAGPIAGTPVSQKVAIASTDWLAADRVGVELMGVDYSKIGYLNYCMRVGNRGQGDLAKIEILGPAIKDYAKTYQLPPQWDQIIGWQKPVAAA